MKHGSIGFKTRIKLIKLQEISANQRCLHPRYQRANPKRLGIAMDIMNRRQRPIKTKFSGK